MLQSSPWELQYIGEDSINNILYLQDSQGQVQKKYGSFVRNYFLYIKNSSKWWPHGNDLNLVC
jgi:hypothetical protein